ncbi:MAG: SpoIIE family protein phosphatase [Bdellovibrionales bacterium]|nr:SpoIIE family protein phosphatase [Bdellovibrionales bacterium]
MLTQFYLSISEYKKDKIAYVFDAALQSSKSTSLMIKSDVEATIKKIQLILRRPLKENFELSNVTKAFIQAEKQINAFYVLKLNRNNNFEITSSSLKGLVNLDEDWLKNIANKAADKPFYIDRPQNSNSSWILALPVAKNSGAKVVVVVEMVDSSFVESFYNPKLQNFYLLDDSGSVVMGPTTAPHEISAESVQEIVKQTNEMSNTSALVKEVKTTEDEFLVASTWVGIANYKVLTVIPKKVALEALQVISVKTGLLVIFLLGIAIIVSVLGASTLTKNLSKLYKAVNGVIKGNLDAKVDIQSKDEVGVLATGFNLMTAKIQELLAETAEKARMEGELKTAQTVQSTLFPNQHFHNDRLEVFGFYEPASECGGDWYSYTALAEKAYFWIGDATGHGVSAALITSAAKSAATVIQSLPELKTSEIMQLMNKAVAETSGGNVLMTFFVGCLDYNTGSFSFTNASHDTPYLFKRKEQYKRKDIIPVMAEPGARLGQDLSSQYIENEIVLEPGDRLVFYTDGLPEIVEETGVQWGEGKFLRSLVKAFNEKSNITEISKAVIADAYDFKNKAILHDDVTFFAIDYRG